MFRDEFPFVNERGYRQSFICTDILTAVNLVKTYDFSEPCKYSDLTTSIIFAYATRIHYYHYYLFCRDESNDRFA